MLINFNIMDQKWRIQEQRSLVFLLIIHLLLASTSLVSADENEDDESHEEIRIGLVMDMNSLEGKIIQSSISIALSEFYGIHREYRTRVSLFVRDSCGEPLQALAAATDLLQTSNVEAIIGAQSLLEAKLLAVIGDKAKVPVISLLAPSSLSLNKYSHFIQVTHDYTAEARGIAGFISGFGWRNIVIVYDDDDDWRESMLFLVEHFQGNGIHIAHLSGFSVSSTEEDIVNHIRNFKASGTTVLVVHMCELLVSRLVGCAGSLGMMDEGYAWILTGKTMNRFHLIDRDAKESMEGAVGFRSYVPVSKELQNFTSRWRKSLATGEVGMDVKELSIFGVWAHDIAWILAMAAETTRLTGHSTHGHGSNFTDPADTKASSNVSALLEAIKHSKFKGLSGHIQFNDNKYLSNTFEILNILGTSERKIGFWSSHGFSSRRHLFSTSELKTIVWPGGSATIPRERSLEESGRRKLRVLVIKHNYIPQLLEVHTDPETGLTTAKGFIIEVFETCVGRLNYEPEYIPWLGGSNYDNLVYAVYSQRDKYDAAVGDITITANRSLYVDFSLPFTDIGLGLLVRKNKGMWTFFHPLDISVWLTSGAFFVLTGIVIWLVEQPVNPEFQGSRRQQIAMIFWFGFSTLVFAHREKLQKSSSRFLVIVWVFVVLILTSNYSANLTSTTTIERIQQIQNVKSYYTARLSVDRNNSYGYKEFVKAMRNGSVPYVIDEMPYLSVLQAACRDEFVVIKRETISNGFGFVFPQGSTLTRNVSREIASLRSSGRLNDMEKRWFQWQPRYPADDSSAIDGSSKRLTIHELGGLFIIAGAAHAIVLAVLLIQRREEMGEFLRELLPFAKLLTKRCFGIW